MPAHPPPVPPASRSTKGRGEDPKEFKIHTESDRVQSQPEKAPTKGHQGNIKQNTTNTGHQQDR
jgi:hypothetical protein